MDPLEPRQLFAVATVAPNDPAYALQYSLRQVHAPEAWKITTGSSRVVVSIHDSGVDYTNADLYLNIWLNQKEVPFKVGKAGLADTDYDGLITFYDLNAKDAKGKLVNGAFVKDLNKTGYIDGGDLLADKRWADGKDQGKNGYVDDLVGWDTIDSDNDPIDVDYHGTFSAGIIGARGNNGLGIAGLNWRVQIMAVRNFNADDETTLEATYEAMRYAADNGARVSNHSYTFEGTVGTPGERDEFRETIEYAGRKGMLVVAGAGNDAFDLDISGPDDVTYLPAAYPLSNVVSVAATGSNNFDQRAWTLSAAENDQPAFFSNYGKTAVSLAAPGWDLLSYVVKDDPSYVHPAGPGITTGDGTSFSTPHVAGAAALMLAANPLLTPADLKRLILASVDKLPQLAEQNATSGRLNVYKAVLAATSPRVRLETIVAAILKKLSGGSKGRWAAIADALVPHRDRLR